MQQFGNKKIKILAVREGEYGPLNWPITVRTNLGI